MSRGLPGSSLFRSAVAALTALGGSGCALFDEDPPILLTVTASFAPGGLPATLTATAVNRSEARVVWGRGSSSCQLDVVVALSRAVWRRAVIPRICTDDLAEQSLDPGASRTEQLVWNGVVRDGESFESLGPGRYELRATAGSEALSPPVAVQVTAITYQTP
jgi:hypothetical protein